MDPAFPHLLRGLAKFLAVLIASLAVGAAIGFGLGKLTGNGAADGSAPIAASPVAQSPKTRPTGASGTPSAVAKKPRSPRIRVLSSSLIPVATPSGRQRQRARVAVKLRVTARGDQAILGTPRLISGADKLTIDSNASDAAGALLDPIRAGKSATGELRFETSGALTSRLAAQRRAKLRIGDRSLPLRLKSP